MPLNHAARPSKNVNAVYKSLPQATSSISSCQEQPPSQLDRAPDHGPLAPMPSKPSIAPEAHIHHARLHSCPPLGREDRVAHEMRTMSDQTIDLGLNINAIDMGGDVPTIVPAPVLGDKANR